MNNLQLMLLCCPEEKNGEVAYVVGGALKESR